jgi:HEAT repeat protein
LRYTVDKTTREILFLPLPADIKLKAKSFVDVTVDRMAKAAAALLLLLLVKPWGLNWNWQQVSYASLCMVGLWIFMSLVARRGYLRAFRESIARRDVAPADVRLSGADLSTVETLVHELSNPVPARVIYAIDMLEALGKGALVTPLLLHHESPEVRARTLKIVAELRPDAAVQWMAHVRKALADPEPQVRVAALRALGSMAHEDTPTLARPLLADADPRIRATAAVALATSERPDDVDAAEATLSEIVGSTSETTRGARRDVAAALGHTPSARFQRLLIPLLYDPAHEVADRAMESVRRAGRADFIFVPTLVSLLRNRQLKGRAREVLVSYGESVIDALAFFMADPNEDEWIRRHIPSTLAMIHSQKSVDALVAQINDADGFLRYKVMSALMRLRRAEGSLKVPVDVVEAVVTRESRQYFRYLSLQYNLTAAGALHEEDLLASALRQKRTRGRNRIFQLLAMIYPPDDIDAADWTLTYGEPRTRASASEYLDNILSGPIRRMVMPIVDDLPEEERVRRGNVLIRSRRRDVEETLLELMNDDDQVIAACAIDMARQRQLWTLAPDIEHILAHRDARDWFVFEAASWSLAERRLQPERRRQKWVEPLPAVVLASQLRVLPLFASLTVEELFRLAAAARQVRHEPGTLLFTERSVPEMLHVLIDGEVTAGSANVAPLTIAAPAAFGFAEALQARPMRRYVRTSGIAVTLVMTSEELRTQLAYNPELVRGLFATMAPQRPEGSRSQINPTGAAPELEQLAADGVRAVDKIIAITHVPVFSHLSAEEARHLATITRTVTMVEGQPLFRATDRPTTWLIMAGEVRLEGTDGVEPTVAVAGDTIGSFSALAGPSVGRDATVTKSGVALCIDRDDLFEMLGDRPEMLKQLFAGVMELAHTRPVAV